jgi:biotin carboxyl carrier protein
VSDAVDSIEAAALVDVPAPSVGFVRWSGGDLAEASGPRDVTKGEEIASIDILQRAVAIGSPATGWLVEILVADGQFVEYGQILGRIAESG